MTIEQWVASRTPKSTGIRDGNHALLTGEIFGCLMTGGLDAEPVMLGRDYTNVLLVTRPSGRYRVVVEAPDAT